MREGIVRILEDGGVDVVGQAADPEALLRLVEATQPDIVLTDIRMPPTHTDEGIAVARRIATDHPGTGILILSQYIDPGFALQLIADHSEGVGYLLRAGGRVPRRHACPPPEIARRRMRGRSHLRLTLGSAATPLATLTAREREVLALVAEGLSNSAIASRLTVTERTVEAHTTQIFQKLGLEPNRDSHRRVLAALTYLQDH